MAGENEGPGPDEASSELEATAPPSVGRPLVPPAPAATQPPRPPEPPPPPPPGSIPPPPLPLPLPPVPAGGVAVPGDLDLPPPDSVPRPMPLTAPKVYPAARLDEVEPSEGTILGETRLTLTGDNLFRYSIVRIDGLIAQTVGAQEPRELRVLTPPRDRPGAVDVVIENPMAPPAVLPGGFRYLPLPPPRITAVAPDHVAARGGAEISIEGQGFVKSTVVTLDGVPATSVRFVSSTTLEVKTPGGENGKLVDVVVKNPDGQSDLARRAFVYDERYR